MPAAKKVPVKRSATAPMRAIAKAIQHADARRSDFLSVRMTSAERAHCDAKGGSGYVRELIVKDMARARK